MRRTGGTLVATVVLFLGLVVPPGPAVASPEGPLVPPVPAHAEVDPSTVLVRFADEISPAGRAATLARHGLGRGARTIGRSAYIEVESAGKSRSELRRLLAGEDGVESIEPNLVRRAFAVEPDDSLYPEQKKYLDLVRMPLAWEAVPPPPVPLPDAIPSPSAGPIIAVIDSGVNPLHEDLVGRVLPGQDFTGDVATANSNDDVGHGTLVAGVAAASTDNALGIAGAAWDARILPVKVLGADGSATDAEVAKGIYWAADNGADVINLSLGGYGANPVTSDAVAYALAKDVVVVAAVGNLFAPLYKVPIYPAAYDGVIGVSATDAAGRSVWFSLWGSWVDIAAPGNQIQATTMDGKYRAADGTSFSAPIVAGVAAIMRTVEPGATQAQIASKLLSTARDTGRTGRDDVYGEGILDAAAAVGKATKQAAIPPPPGDLYEPNDSVATAKMVALGTPISATIAPEGEVDRYQFSVPAGSRVAIEVQAPPTIGFVYALDPMLQLRTASGTPIQSRDAAGMGRPELLTFETPAGGTFVVDVENFLPTLGSGPYSLRVSSTPISPPTTATATPTTAAPPPPPTTTPPAPTPPPPPPKKSGYWMVGKDGAVYGFGDARNHGRVVGMEGGIEAVDLEPTPSLGGYWIVTNSGHVHAIGDAPSLGGLDGALVFGEAVTSISRTASGRGYWLFTTKGRVVAFGDAPHLGDMSGTRLNGPVLDSIPSPSGNGYYMVASDGGIFTFGDAVFQGSMGGIPLNAPVQSLVPDADGAGYWLVASDGGIFSFDAPFRGSMGDTRLNGPITGMVRFGNGYLMVGTDGGIFTFTDKEFFGSLGANPPGSPIVSVAAAEG